MPAYLRCRAEPKYGCAITDHSSSGVGAFPKSTYMLHSHSSLAGSCHLTPCLSVC